MRKIDQNKYIQRVKKKHGLKYDYSKISFNDWKDKIDIICKIHGPFKKRVDAFLTAGCQKCSIESFKKKISLSTEEFVNKSLKVHGDLYDYINSECKGTKQNVEIICPLQGSFFQRVDAHLNGSICPKCSKEIRINKLLKATALKKFSLKKVIKKSLDLHKIYEYDLNIEYENTDSYLRIKCSEHGWFYQRATKHLKGQGCPECSYLLIAEKNTKTTNAFVEQARKRHNNFYDYSKTVYISAHKKILIICPNHGLFEQNANSHLKGAGCLKCSIIRIRDKLSSSSNEFINKSKFIHEDLYDYSKVNYKNSYIKVSIICSIHGEFKQKPVIHLSGSGCPICSSSKGEKKVIKYLKNKKIDYIHQWVDHDCRPNKRLAVFDFMLPALKIIIEYDGEQHFKIKFKPKKDMKIAYEKLKKIKYNDFYKNNWAMLNNYKMIRIKYTEDVFKTLNKYFD